MKQWSGVSSIDKTPLHYLFLYSVGVTPNFCLKHLLK